MDLYAQNILDRYKNPLYKDKKISAMVSRKEANHTCGDEVEVSLEMKGDKVDGYSFKGQGCAISMASADLLGDLIEGLSPDEILNLKKEDIYQALGIEISIRRSKCALLPMLATQNGLLADAKRPLRNWNSYHLE